jgi:hypothetical protein
MQLNHKQEELVENMFNKVKKKFPEIIFKNLETSPDDPEHIWINVLADMDEDKEIRLIQYSSKIDYNFFMKYGYRISIMPENPSLVYN